MGRDPEQAKTIDRCSLQPGASHVSKYEQINYFGATVFIYFFFICQMEDKKFC